MTRERREKREKRESAFRAQFFLFFLSVKFFVKKKGDPFWKKKNKKIKKCDKHSSVVHFAKTRWNKNTRLHARIR